MKTNILAAIITLGVAIVPFAAHSQVQSYYYSGPVSGFVEVALTSSNPDLFPSGGFSANFGTISEVLNYNPSAQTLEEIGSVTVSPSSGSFDMVIDNGGSDVVIGSASLTVGDNGVISFDQLFNLGPYSPYRSGFNLPVSGTATYNGQTGPVSWDLTAFSNPTVISATPTSLTFTEGEFDDGIGGLFPSPFPLPGLVAGTGNAQYVESFYVSGVASAVPETPSCAVYAIAAAGLAFMGRIKRSAWLVKP